MAIQLEPSWRTISPRREPRIKLRTGVVGLGKQALEDHIPGLHASDSADLVAVCDENAEIVREQQYQHRVQGYTDFHEMFKDERLDFVVVCVPHHVGRTVIETAAKHNVHVLKEKPFATTIQEARALVNICEDAGIHLMVTLQRRFNPIYTSFMQLADQIGTPFVVDAQYTLHIDDPSEGWRGMTTKAGGGCIIDMGYHLIDGVRRRRHRAYSLLLRQRPVRLSAALPVHRSQDRTNPPGRIQGHGASGTRPDSTPRQWWRRDRVAVT